MEFLNREDGGRSGELEPQAPGASRPHPSSGSKVLLPGKAQSISVPFTAAPYLGENELTSARRPHPFTLSFFLMKANGLPWVIHSCYNLSPKSVNRAADLVCDTVGIRAVLSWRVSSPYGQEPAALNLLAGKPHFPALPWASGCLELYLICLIFYYGFTYMYIHTHIYTYYVL